MIRRIALSALAGLALVSGSAAAGEKKEEGFQLMPMDQVEKALGQGLYVFDVNVPDLWAKHHLPGAVHVTGKELAPLLPADRQARMVFYCSNKK